MIIGKDIELLEFMEYWREGKIYINLGKVLQVIRKVKYSWSPQSFTLAIIYSMGMNFLFIANN